MINYVTALKNLMLYMMGLREWQPHTVDSVWLTTVSKRKSEQFLVHLMATYPAKDPEFYIETFGVLSSAQLDNCLNDMFKELHRFTEEQILSIVIAMADRADGRTMARFLRHLTNAVSKDKTVNVLTMLLPALSQHEISKPVVFRNRVIDTVTRFAKVSKTDVELYLGNTGWDYHRHPMGKVPS